MSCRDTRRVKLLLSHCDCKQREICVQEGNISATVHQSNSFVILHHRNALLLEHVS